MEAIQDSVEDALLEKGAYKVCKDLYKNIDTREIWVRKSNSTDETDF